MCLHNHTLTHLCTPYSINQSLISSHDWTFVSIKDITRNFNCGAVINTRNNIKSRANNIKNLHIFQLIWLRSSWTTNCSEFYLVNVFGEIVWENSLCESSLDSVSKGAKRVFIRDIQSVLKCRESLKSWAWLQSSISGVARAHCQAYFFVARMRNAVIFLKSMWRAGESASFWVSKDISVSKEFTKLLMNRGPSA